MKPSLKKALIAACSLFVVNFLTAQTHNTVEVDDEVYRILQVAEIRGYCGILSTAKPYTKRYIIDRLDEILSKVESGSVEEKIALQQKERFTPREDGFSWKGFGWRWSNAKDENAKHPFSFQFDEAVDISFFGGLYNKSEKNDGAYEIWNHWLFAGDLGRNLSFHASGDIAFMKLPLEEVGTYEIGYWWDDKKSDGIKEGSSVRTIRQYRNNFSAPYSYKKRFDGSLFFLSQMDNSGLEGWPFENSFAYGMTAELTGSFLDDHIRLGFGRYRREHAAMDNGSSLVLNASARPYFGFDAAFEPFKWLSATISVGNLEFPNQGYINENAWNAEGENSRNDYKYFQNMFAIGMINADWKYFHFDFGSSAIYSKRPEMAYWLPIFDRVVSQDNIGDCDNLSLFTDIKFKIPGKGIIWGSFYLDEKKTLKLGKELIEDTRNMFSYQLGGKIYLPIKKFAVASFRYTKIEPYCYTHQAINYAPGYSTYMSESYSNNGYSLGYYLPPNSDEFLLKFELSPNECSTTGLAAQLTRHGADYGSGQVPGSSIYSEMNPKNRDDLKKYFLMDGAYEWNFALILSGSYDFRKKGLPFSVNGSFGVVRTWWTTTDATEKEGLAKAGFHGKEDYYTIDTDEYPTKTGVVMSVGVKIFGQ